MQHEDLVEPNVSLVLIILIVYECTSGNDINITLDETTG